MKLFDELIQLQLSAEPRIIWEMDKETFQAVRRIKDNIGTYIWLPEPNNRDMPGTLLGHQISISKNKCLQIKYLFPDGSEKVFNANGN